MFGFICICCAITMNTNSKSKLYFVMDSDSLTVVVESDDCNELIYPVIRQGINYYFLPSFVDINSISGDRLSSATDIRIDEDRISSTSNIDVQYGQKYDLSVNGQACEAIFLRADNVASIFLETSTGDMEYVEQEKGNIDVGKLQVIDQNAVCWYSGDFSIAGRGNSTWVAFKKPYRLELSEKANLFGMGEAKEWVLLANTYDSSYMNNVLAYDMSSYVGIPYTPQTEYVNLYCNGAYWGLYLLSEKVEVGKERINITNLKEANSIANNGMDLSTAQTFDYYNKRGVILENNPEDITGGYLLEINYRSASDVLKDRQYPESWFETSLKTSIDIVSPRYASCEEVDYISELIENMVEAFAADDGFSSEGRYYTEYIDLESWVKWYMASEIPYDLDKGKTSTYMYKDIDNVSNGIYMGPVWDYDLRWNEDPQVLTKLNDIGNVQWYSQLYDKPEFYNAIVEYWPIYKYYLEELAPERIDVWESEIESSVEMDNIRWGREDYNLADKTDELKEWITLRTEYLDTCWSGDAN